MGLDRSELIDTKLEEAALGVGGGKLEGAAVVRESIRWPAEAAEQVGAGGVQEVILPQLRVEGEGVEEGEASIRTLGKGHGYRSVEIDDGRRGHLAEVGVEGGDAGEVGRLGGRVPGGDPFCLYSPTKSLFWTLMMPVGEVSSTKRSVAVSRSESLA